MNMCLGNASAGEGRKAARQLLRSGDVAVQSADQGPQLVAPVPLPVRPVAGRRRAGPRSAAGRIQNARLPTPGEHPQSNSQLQ